MRLANEHDQAIIRSAIADSSASSLAFLSSMGQREAIAFGEGVATTMRLKFEKLDAKLIPGAQKRHEEEAAAGNGDDVDLINIASGRATCRSAPTNLTFAEPGSAPSCSRAILATASLTHKLPGRSPSRTTSISAMG